jgi:hypothetical protein
MNPTRARTGAKLLSIPQAAQESGLPEARLRELIRRGDLAAVQLPNVRRIFVVRIDLERKLQQWVIQP